MPIKPFLRWAGSKRQMISRLVPFWLGEHKRYIEPFAGSACLFFYLEPERALLNDLNAELIRTMVAVRDAWEEVAYYLSLLRPCKEIYLWLRKENTSGYSDPQAAARFIYLNRLCFNGLYRTNLKGEFNVPYAPYKAGAMPNKICLQQCSHVLASAEIRAADFEEVLEEATEGDFVYMDPPFALDEGRGFIEYGVNAEFRLPFTSDDLDRLTKWLPILDERGASFVLSYANTKQAATAFAGWHCSTVKAKRQIAGNHADRRVAEELVVTNIKVAQ
ncbi:MAG TPA: Dam family site-specific DNA-(adenine-N6)-methyltransferase [Chthonomonadaceae bacterium]|nr:Dam family site-specific DNA-(adenine-N6)-methyltransferase [Chthonomonadaceae bacterium]